MPSQTKKEKDDPVGDAKKLCKELKGRSMSGLSKELSEIAEGMKTTAMEWKSGDEGDLGKLFNDALEIPMTHYDIWLLGEKLYSVQANAVRNQFTRAFNQGDAVAASELYTEDAKFLPPNSSIVEGRIYPKWSTQTADGS